MAWTYNTPEGTPTNGPMIAGVTLAFTALSLMFVCVRLYVRFVMIKAVGWDDWTIVVAWLGAAGYTIAAAIQTKWGLGLTSLDDMPDENVYDFGLVQYAGAPFYVVGIWGFKFSLLLSYLRFFPKEYRIATIIIMVGITMAHVAFICVFLFLCTPIEKQWDPAVTGGHCADGVPFYLSFSALTLIFDVLVMVLPFPVLLKSKIQQRKKIVLLGLFALGVFVTVIQIVRIQTIKSLQNYLDSAKSILWSIIENDVGIIITCVPTLSPLVKYFNEKTRSGTGSNSRKPGSRYALQSWGTKGGMRPLGSGHEPESREGDAASNSTENILHPVGITKTTDVIITRQRRDDSPEQNAF